MSVAEVARENQAIFVFNDAKMLLRITEAELLSTTVKMQTFLEKAVHQDSNKRQVKAENVVSKKMIKRSLFNVKLFKKYKLAVLQICPQRMSVSRFIILNAPRPAVLARHASIFVLLLF